MYVCMYVLDLYYYYSVKSSEGISAFNAYLTCM